MEFKLKEIALDPSLMQPNGMQKAIETYKEMQSDLAKLKRLTDSNLTDEEFWEILKRFYVWDLDDAKELAKLMAGDKALEQDFVLSSPAFSGKLFCEERVPKQVFTWDDFREYMQSKNAVLWDLDNFGTPEISTPKIDILPFQFTEVFHLLVGQTVPSKFDDLKLYGDIAMSQLKKAFTPEKRAQDIIHYVHMLQAVGKNVNILVGANLDILIDQAASLVNNGNDIVQDLADLESSLTRL